MAGNPEPKSKPTRLKRKDSMSKAALYLTLVTAIFTSGCREKNTQNPSEVYNLWSGGEKPPKVVHLIHGKYWQSAHWSKEYIMYLELEAPSKWRQDFVKDNKLVYKKDTVIQLYDDAPVWFKPTPAFKVYTPSGFSQGSAIFEDSISGRMFIVDIQL